ncbi:MAG: S-methyl-5-thioribose-1-phosphate isomerase [Nitrososphaerota archaeon]|nr:S-methyl-5-thioribose-1-phosphate isomerase [Nitrososphaerota archaeon]MDG6982888.1 S-methyl-5-thioribose-1-phosphate isomerase [Nitrososphaerota archaeon]
MRTHPEILKSGARLTRHVANFFSLRTVTWADGKVKMIDQTALPTKFSYVTYTTPEQVAGAIKTMVVRGAPAIGVAAAMGVALAARRSKAKRLPELMRDLEQAAAMLRATRPTAVNLFWGIDRVMAKAGQARSAREAADSAAAEAKAMEDEDVEVNRKLGANGAHLIRDGDTVLTQCNAGALATVGYGTALGVVRAAVEQGKLVKVLVPETRPALQGARLTAYELVRDRIACTLISDTAVGYMFSRDRIDLVIVGADRITKDGYVFNKIGTYQEAVLAKRHGVPFHPAAPRSTFDLAREHHQVTIEERGAEEVVTVRGKRVAPKGIPVANPAFDMTPPELVTSIVTERGLAVPPFEESITRLMS